MLRKYNHLEKGVAFNLPIAYKKFYNEWKFGIQSAVHYIPKQTNSKCQERGNEMLRVCDIPLPLHYPIEFNKQLWGAEGVLQGFLKKKAKKRRNPKIWLPTLHRSVIYSEILDKYITVVLTERTLQLIHSHYGFDHYLLKTPAHDLQSLLALGLKRRILQDLQCGCPSHAGNPIKQKEVFNNYHIYLSLYSSEEIEWYGYSLQDACAKWMKTKANELQSCSFKQICRAAINTKLKAKFSDDNDKMDSTANGDQPWFKKINPFIKKEAQKI